MKTILRGLVVACAAALGLNAWADTTVWSNLNSSETTVEKAGAADVVLCLQPTAEVPAGSSVKLTKIVIADRPNRDSTTPVYKITVGGADYYTNARAAGEEAQVNTGAAEPVSRGMSIYTFAEGSEPVISVGVPYVAATCNADHSAQTGNERGGASCAKVASPATSGILWWNHSTSTTSGWNVLGELHGTVVSTPSVGDYVASVSEDCNFSSIVWDRDLNWDDATSESTLTLNIASGKTVTLDKDIDVASILISGGTLAIAADATHTIAGAGTISSKVTTAAGSTLKTNGDIAMGDGQTQISGALNVNGGTLTLTAQQNGGLNNNVVTIASGATFKSGVNDMPHHTGTHPTTIHVYGTLDFANTRWTLSTGEKIVAYKGASIVGDGDQWGAMDPNGKTDTVLEVSNADGEGTVTCSASIRARSAAKVDVAEGMILDYTAAITNGSSQNNTITKTGLGTMKLSGNSATTGGLTVSAGKMIVSNATVAGGILISEGAEAELVNTAEAALPVPTIKDGTVGSVTLVSGAFDYGTQRKAIVLGETATIKVTTTTQEAAAGTLTIPGAKEGKVSVFDANGNELTVASVSEDGVITLNTNEPITANCNLSEKIAAGTLIVQGSTEGDPITVNINCPMPNTSLTVTGEVIFNFVEGSEASAGTITLESGAVVTVSGTINNSITLSDGATLITSGEVTFGEGKQIARSANNKNATLTIAEGSTLTLVAGDSINTCVTLNVYGTLDLGGQSIGLKSFGDEATYNFYAGSTIKNGWANHSGGYELVMNVYDVETVIEKTVTFSANMDLTYWPGVKSVFSCASGVAVNFTGETRDVGSLTIRGSNGQDIHVLKGNYGTGDAGRVVKGAIVIDQGATLSVGRYDAVEYKSPVANFDIYGTLDLGAYRTTISAEGGHNVIKIHDGGRIAGAGQMHDNNLKSMDVCSDQTIGVDGTVSIEGPIWARGTNKITFSLNEGATAANVTLTAGVVCSGKSAIGAGVALTVPSTMTAPEGAVAKIENGDTVTYYASANAAVAASSAEHPAIAVADFTNSTDGLVHANQVLVIPTGITVTATHDMIWWRDNGKVVVEGTLNANCNTTLTNGSLELHEGAVVGGTGSLKVDSNKTIVVTGDASVAKISVQNSKTLTLDITEGKTLTVGNFIHTGSNKVEVPTGTLVVTANDAATGIVYEIAGDAALTHDLTALGQLIKVKAAEGATITITSSANPETTELQASEPVDGVVTYTVVEKQTGPTSWDAITAEDLPATFAGAGLDAVKTWAAKYAGTFSAEALADLDVEAFLLDCAPDAVDTAKAAFKIISVENVGGEWIVKVAGNVGEGEKYGNGYVVIESVKAELFPEAGDDADFFQATLQMTAPVAE